MRARSLHALGPTFLAACVLMFPQTAHSTDYLRGSHYGDASSGDGAVDWSGFYAGGFAGYSNVNLDSSKAPGGLISNYLRNTVIENELRVSSLLSLPSRSTSKESFGGFVGYNTQWGDVVLGVEADYTYLGMTNSNADQIGRSLVLSNGYRASAYVTGDASVKLDQITTVRARAGYTVGNFMPYVTGGFAFGTGKVTNAATVYTQQVDADPTDNVYLPTITNSADLKGGRSSATMYGGVVGGGLEAMFGNLLVRGEVLYARLGTQGKATVEHTTARVGAGIKF